MGNQTESPESPDLESYLDPIQHRIFHGDIVQYIDHQVILEHSPTRSATYLPGILVLVGNRTYGRSTTGQKRLLYQCIPDNKRLPVFLVPYEHKHLGFSKHIQNKYVLFRWVSWSEGNDKHPMGHDNCPLGNESLGGSAALLCNAKASQGTDPRDLSLGYDKHPMGHDNCPLGKDKHPMGHDNCPLGKDKHPMGQLTEVLGDVDHLESFYEYQLYSKSLHTSIKDMQRAVDTRIVRSNVGGMDAAIESIQNTYAIEDRTDVHVFTIDPPNSLDYDDGFSIRTDAVTGLTVVTVYIANVFVWLEHFHLWESFSNRVATIYLPDRFRRPMLPTILSDSLCSLQKGHIRFALAMDFIMNPLTGHAEEGSPPIMVAIRPTANYAYESPELFRDVQYQQLKRVTPGAPKNSHNLVTWWMIHTNSYVAEYMKTVRRAGIFRIGKTNEIQGGSESDTKTTTDTISMLDPSIGEDAARVMLHWKHMMGQYVAYGDTDMTHMWLGRSVYMHMTSPIRRLVDLLNQMMLFDAVLSPAAKAFVETWMGKLEYINTTMRSIRKVESTCQLICLCTNRPDVLSATHRGIVFDKTVTENESKYAYMVYLEELRVLVRMTRSTRSVDNHSRHEFRLHLFESEHTTKKKIRIGFA